MTVLFHDDFERPNSTTVGNGWSQSTTTDPRIVGGVLQSQAVAWGGVHRGFSEPFLDVEVVARLRTGNAGGAVSVDVFYGTTVAVQYRIQSALVNVTEGLATIKKQEPAAGLKLTEWTTFRVTLVGQVARLFVNGVERLVYDGGIDRNIADSTGVFRVRLLSDQVEVDSVTQYDHTPRIATFDPQGGGAVPSQESPVTFPLSARDGYALLGWDTQANGLGTRYGVGNTLTLTEDTTFYAVWSDHSDVPLKTLPWKGWFGSSDELYTAGWFPQADRVLSPQVTIGIASDITLSYTGDGDTDSRGWFLRPASTADWNATESEATPWMTTTTVEGEWTVREAEDTDPVTRPAEGE